MFKAIFCIIYKLCSNVTITHHWVTFTRYKSTVESNGENVVSHNFFYVMVYYFIQKPSELFVNNNCILRIQLNLN